MADPREKLRAAAIEDKITKQLEALRAQGIDDDQIASLAPQLYEEVGRQTAGSDAADKGAIGPLAHDFVSPGPWADAPGNMSKRDRLKVSSVNLRNQADAIEAEPDPSLTGEIGDAFQGQVDAVKDPRKRREMLRGVSDTVTFGGAERLARLVDDKFSEEQGAQDAEEVGTNYRTGGQVAGTLMPGASGTVVRNLAGAGARLAAKTGGRVAGALVGAGAGMASVPVASGVIAAGQQAVGQLDPLGAPSAGWDAAKSAGSNPLAMALGALGGAASGYGAGVRGGNSQTAQDMALRQELGGKASLGRGAKGGAFEDPAIAGLRGSTDEIGRVADASANKLATNLTSQFKNEVGKPYNAAKSAIEASDEVTDLAPLIDVAKKVQASKGTTIPVRGLIQREILDDLEEFKQVADDGAVSYNMPVSVANEVRQKLSDFAKTGSVDVPRGNAKIGELYNASKSLVGDFEEANAAYSAGKDKFAESFRQLGSKKPVNKLPEGPGAKVRMAQELVTKQISDRLFRGGEKARLTGQEADDLAAFIKKHPELELDVRLPEILAAKNRLGFKIPEGGLLPSVKGIVTQNIEPLEANLTVPLADSMRTVAPTAGATANPIMRGYEVQRERERRLAEARRGR
jgi:hypothetical protein